MAKLILLSLLVSVLQLESASVFAANEPILPQTLVFNGGFCDAQAPENFQVLSMGSDLVSLGWTPAWVGAIQTLEVSIQENGIWIPLFANYNVPESSYILGNLEPGYYLATIATNCASGESSINVSTLEFEFKIIDLTTEGRVPLNPVAVEDCANIDFLNHEWVGFKVTEIATGDANLFEFQFFLDENPRIKRVIYEHPIVAVDLQGSFPLEPNLIIKAHAPFRMDDRNDENPDNLVNIGFVNCNNDNSPGILNLCIDDDNPPVDWKPEYTFVAMTAEKVIDSPFPDGKSSENAVKDTLEHGKFSAQSPFYESLSIFVPQNRLDFGKANTKIRLLNINGQEIVANDFDLNTSHVTIPTESLLPGIYLLQIKMDCETQSFKVIKSK